MGLSVGTSYSVNATLEAAKFPTMDWNIFSSMSRATNYSCSALSKIAL